MIEAERKTLMKYGKILRAAALDMAVGVLVSFAVCCFIAGGVSFIGLAPILLFFLFTAIFLIGELLPFLRRRKYLRVLILAAAAVGALCVLIFAG